jgi:hypothetical protein
VPETIKAKIGITDVEWLGPLMRASELLYMMSGRRWLGGGCEETAVLRSAPPRPGEGTWPYEKSWGNCTCWVHAEWIDGQPYNLTSDRFNHIGQPFGVRLPRSPITGVSSVKISGETFTGWRWLPSGWLERVDGKPWPTCGGTAEVTYQFGQAPPSGGRDAAIALAIELARDMYGLEGCNLPTRITSVTRQNVTMEMASAIEVLREGGTGVYVVDLWLKAVNPESRPQRAAVWSPDVPRLSRRRF